MKRFLFLLALVFSTSAAHSDEEIASYLTWLGPKDMQTSHGVKLQSFGDILAQDRANYHRFGVRDQLDTSDPIFGNREMRSKLPAFFKAGRQVEKYIRDNVLSGKGHYVFVRVMGEKGRVTHVDVYEGAG